MATVNSTVMALDNVPKPKGIKELIEASTEELGRALPAHLNPERLVRIALTNVRLVPDLVNCTSESFLGALFTLAQLGLEPVAGRAYLLPYNNKKKDANGKDVYVKEVQALIGYKGLIDLFYRHESALSIDMQTVHAADAFDYQYGTESFLRHKPVLKDRGDVIGFYAVAKMRGGASIFRFMSKQDALEHGKKHSKTYDGKSEKFSPYSPWHKEADAMCMKTVLIQLAKLLPLSIELQRAITVDETSRDYRKGIDDALDLPVTMAWDADESLAADRAIVAEEAAK
jgi:recombination protein RecT